jgi:hypothetical protein
MGSASKSAEKDDLALADLMIEMHGPRAISEAQISLEKYAVMGNRDAASKWLRVMSLIEFAELRAAIQ